MVVDGLGFLNRSSKLQTLRVKRVVPVLLQLHHLEVVFLHMLLENVCRADSHGTVDVYGKDGNLVFQFKFAKDVKQLLRTPYSK